jgi:YD repeat-containing protein
MRSLVCVALVACSNELARPERAPIMPCPRTASTELPWTREVFPACAPPGVPRFCTSCTPCKPPKQYTGTLERDAAGRITRVVGTKGELSEYHYDAAGRVTSLDDIIYGHAELLYDKAGWLAEERTPDGVFIYHYDARGRATKREQAARSIRIRYDGERVVEIVDAGKPVKLDCE